MNVTQDTIDSLQGTIKIEVTKEDYASKVNEALRNQQRNANVPGFRKGKVPIEIIKRMCGKRLILDEVNKMVEEWYNNFVTENRGRLLGDPIHRDNQIDLDGENLEIFFDVAYAPEYNVKLTKREKVVVYKIIVDDVAIDQEMADILQSSGEMVAVDAVVDGTEYLVGRLVELDAAGEEKEGGICKEDASMLLRYVKDEAAAAAFAGATNGSRVVFNLLKAYPNETDLAAMLQVSKEVVRALVSDFAFTVGEIRRYKKAEVSQALFDKLYGEGKVNSEAEFREKIRERLEQQYKEHSDYRFNIDAKEKMFRKNEAVPFPDDFFRRWIARVSKDATPKELEEIFPSTKESFEWGFIKQAMQKEYNIQVTEEDARVCARSLAASELRQRGYYYFTAEDLDGYAEQIMKDEQQREKSYNMALDEMVFACIRENVKLDEQDITLDDFQKLFK